MQRRKTLTCCVPQQELTNIYFSPLLSWPPGLAANMTVGQEASSGVLPPCRLRHPREKEAGLNLAHLDVPCSVSSLRVAGRALGPEESTVGPFTHFPSWLSTTFLTLYLAQRRCPRCVCCIAPSHCWHFNELLLEHENSYVVKWCLPASVVFPSSASSLANILWEVWPICRKLTAGIQNFQDLGLISAKQDNTGSMTMRNRLCCLFLLSQHFKFVYYPPIYNFLLQKVI